MNDSDTLPPNTLDDTFSGQPVLEYADPRVIEFYRALFWQEKNPEQCDQMFAWIHSFCDNCISRKDTIEPLYKSVFGPQTAESPGITPTQFAAIMVFSTHYKEPWLYRRLTMHALSFLERHTHDNYGSTLAAAVLNIQDMLLKRLNYTVRDVYAEMELRKQMATEETTRMTKASKDDSLDESAVKKPRPKLVECVFCHKKVPEATAHIHQGLWVGDACCWDERLRTTE